jgi:adenine-specific DNA methylase
VRLLESGAVSADLAYFDPPYGGASSDYSSLYGMCEEYIRGCDPMTIPSFCEASKRFCGKKEYENNFSAMLDLSRKFPVWLFSFNESSYASIDDITSLIGKFRSRIVVKPIKNYGYNYRKRTHSSDRESEFLILARG